MDTVIRFEKAMTQEETILGTTARKVKIVVLDALKSPDFEGNLDYLLRILDRLLSQDDDSIQ